jgi:hypothetical protein
MKIRTAGCEVVALRRATNAHETLAVMRARYDRGGYVLLRIVGVTHDGDEERLEVYAPAHYETTADCVPSRWESAPLDRLASMRARFDAGEYRIYVAVATDREGFMDRVTLYSEARSRWVANQ